LGLLVLGNVADWTNGGVGEGRYLGRLSLLRGGMAGHDGFHLGFWKLFFFFFLFFFLWLLLLIICRASD
jgi:hypothetical protein